MTQHQNVACMTMTTLPHRRRFLASLLVLSLFLHVSHADAYTPPQYYHDQLVDHTCPHKNNRTWTQRYYTSTQHFQGPGHPIFLVLGGEGAIPPEAGLFYPFVNERLAQAFGAFVLQPEHRYYGTSIPVPVTTSKDPRDVLLTPEQALYDAVRLTKHIQEVLQCSLDKFSDKYCAVISVGGSYPGFLSMAARLRFPETVDMAYAASAPVKFYAQQVHRNWYYNHIARVAEKSKAGCANAVRTTLDALARHYTKLSSRQDIETAAASVGFCPDSVPAYIQNETTWREELFMVVGYTFANDNMANYPPNNMTKLYSSCSIFMNDTTSSPTERLKNFIEFHFSKEHEDCIDMSLQLPTGKHATISGGDWSGVGTGTSGESWDFQTCTLLVEAIGFGKRGMFPPRQWTRSWLKQHCQNRFHVTPKPTLLAKAWHFDDLHRSNASRILFTNGLNDGWSVGGILTNVSETIVSLNFPNGAHHSDLSHVGPSENDTEDIREGFDKIQAILSKWLEDVKSLSTRESEGIPTR